MPTPGGDISTTEIWTAPVEEELPVEEETTEDANKD